MPSPRTCRNCGAAVSVDVRWCGLCHEPVREFAPRAPMHEGDFVDAPRHDVRYSRWRSGPLSFGPLGKIVVTFIVLAVGPWGPVTPFSLWHGLMWAIFATVVLKSLWRRQPIDPADEAPARWRGRIPDPLLRVVRLPAWTGKALLVALVGGSVVVWIAADAGGRYLLACLVVTVAVGLYVSSASEL